MSCVRLKTNVQFDVMQINYIGSLFQFVYESMHVKISTTIHQSRFSLKSSLHALSDLQPYEAHAPLLGAVYMGSVK